MGIALRFRQTHSIPRQPGEHARLKVVQGPDTGAVYVLTGPRASIGRGEDNDVMIADLKASRKHAEVYLNPQGVWHVRDLGSANGILHQGAEKRETRLQGVDQLGVGETVFEFVDARAPDLQLVASPKSPLELQRSASALEQQRERVRALGKSAKSSPVAKAPGASRPKAKGGRALLVPVLLGALAFLYFGLSPDKPKPAKTATEAATGAATPNRDLASFYGSIQDSPETARQAETFFKAGFREFREQNFLRARQNFENVLQVSPGHQLARNYLLKSTQAIDEQVSNNLELGKRAMDSGKLKAARAHFEAVLRLLYRDASNPKYEEARSQIDKVNAQAKGGSS